MKRICIILILSVLLINCAPSIDVNKFEKLHRAAKSIEAAISTGVNYNKFNELLQNYSTELLIVKDKVKRDEEENLLDKYLLIHDIYMDSFTIWDYKVESGDSYLFSGPLKTIIEKYQIETSPFEKISSIYTDMPGWKANLYEKTYGDSSVFYGDSAIKKIWQKASEDMQGLTKYREEHTKSKFLL